jgi:phosphopantetheine adenylyltransferase
MYAVIRETFGYQILLLVLKCHHLTVSVRRVREKNKYLYDCFLKYIMRMLPHVETLFTKPKYGS